jgi:aminobenzoyl-glutamate transport protein
MNPLALLARIENAGNKLPNPTLLFIYLSIAILIVSALSSFFDVSAEHPISGVTITAVNLISTEGLHLILKNTVTNFVQFAPVGTVLVAVLGIGIAEHSGLLNTVLKVTVQRAPNSLLSFFVVFAGVLSSLAMDTGYVVLIPLAAIIFLNANRNPLIGIAAAFASVSGGFSANLLIGPIDAILSGISTEAAQLVQPGYEVSAAGNYYFIVISTFVLAITGAVVTEKIISPRYDNTAALLAPSVRQPTQLSPAEQKGLRAVGLFSVIVLLMLLAGLLPEQGVLRNPENGSITSSPS